MVGGDEETQILSHGALNNHSMTHAFALTCPKHCRVVQNLGSEEFALFRLWLTFGHPMAPLWGLFWRHLCVRGSLSRAFAPQVSLQLSKKWGFSSQRIPEGETGRRGTKKDDKITLKWGPGALNLLVFVCRLQVSFLCGCPGFCWFDFCLLSMMLVNYVFFFTACMLLSMARENWGPREARRSILQILFAVIDLFWFLFGIF